MEKETLNPGRVKIMLLVFFMGMLLFGVGAFWLDRVLMSEDVERAESLILDEKWSEAIVAFENLVKTHPDKFRHKYNLGNLYFLTKNYPKAEEAYTQVLNAPELDWRKFAIYNLGDTAFCQNRLKEAIQYFDAAHAMDPAYDKARWNADFTREIREQMQNQPDLARERLKESCLQFNPDQKENQKEDQKKEDKKEDDQKDKDKKDPSQKQDQNQPSGQDQEKNQQKSGDQNQDQGQNQKQQDQVQGEGQGEDKQEQGEGEQQTSDKSLQKNNEENGQSAQQNGQDKQDLRGAQEQNPEQQKSGQQQQDGSTTQNGDAFHGKKDPDAEHWLYLLDDDPGKALQYMIRKKAMDKKKRFDKNW